MAGARLEKWERTLHHVLAEIDAWLEEEYGHDYPLRPNRPPHGATANRAYDGLFEVGAKYSLGIGSEHGKGYVVKVRMATFVDVPDEIEVRIEDEVAELLGKKLPVAFPGRDLRVSRDGHVYKIHGDFSL